MSGMAPNVVPFFGMAESASMWGNAACIIPWNLYRFYRDRSILEDQYDNSMKACGLYKSSWQMADPSHMEMCFSVPFGGSATLVLPHAGPEAYRAFQDVRDGVCFLEQGEYVVSYETDMPLP